MYADPAKRRAGLELTESGAGGKAGGDMKAAPGAGATPRTPPMDMGVVYPGKGRANSDPEVGCDCLKGGSLEREHPECASTLTTALRAMPGLLVLMLTAVIFGLSVALKNLAERNPSDAPWFMVLAPLKAMPGTSLTIYGNLAQFSVLVPGSNKEVTYPLSKVSSAGEELGFQAFNGLAVSVGASAAMFLLTCAFRVLAAAGALPGLKSREGRVMAALMQVLFGIGAAAFGIILAVVGLSKFPKQVGYDLRHNPEKSGLTGMLSVDKVVMRWAASSEIDDPSTTCIITADRPIYAYTAMCTAWLTLALMLFTQAYMNYTAGQRLAAKGSAPKSASPSSAGSSPDPVSPLKFTENPNFKGSPQH